MWLLLFWVACSVVSWFIYASLWRRSFDITIGDAIILAMLSSIGPISLIAACLSAAVMIMMDLKTPVLWRKK